MKVKTYLIDALAHLLFSDRFWSDVKAFVQDAENSGLSGAEKKARVEEDLRAVFGDVAQFAINLGIELAKAYIAIQAPEFAPLVNAVADRAEAQS